METLKLLKCPQCGSQFTRLSNGTLWGFWIDELPDSNTVDTFVDYVKRVLKEADMKNPQYIHCYEDHGFGSGSPNKGRYTGLRMKFKSETKTDKTGPAVGMHLYDQNANVGISTIFFADEHALLQLAAEALKGYQFLRESKEL